MQVLRRAIIQPTTFGHLILTHNRRHEIMEPVGIAIFAIFILLVVAAIVLPKLSRNRAQR